MKAINVFDHNIIKHEVPSYLYSSKLLESDVDKLFNSDFILQNGNKSLEKCGKGYSTCDFGSDLIINLSDISPLFEYISSFIIKYFDSSSKKEKILYTRIWANKVYKDCLGECHVHGGINDGSAIFYYKCPNNSSDLIILKNKIEGIVKDEHKDVSKYIKVKPGDLIIHDKNVPHAISKHMSEDPRICFVFDFKLI